MCGFCVRLHRSFVPSRAVEDVQKKALTDPLSGGGPRGKQAAGLAASAGPSPTGGAPPPGRHPSSMHAAPDPRAPFAVARGGIAAPSAGLAGVQRPHKLAWKTSTQPGMAPAAAAAAPAPAPAASPSAAADHPGRAAPVTIGRASRAHRLIGVTHTSSGRFEAQIAHTPPPAAGAAPDPSGGPSRLIYLVRPLRL